MKNILTKLSNFPRTDAGESFLSSIFAIVFGVLFGFLLMLVFNPTEAFDGLWIILSGGFEDGSSSLGKVLTHATPIIITGLSVGFAFRTGLFNIGATGQLTVGAFASIYIGVNWTFLPGDLHWMAAVLGAILAGAFWGLIPGILKAFLNVHEVVATIMLNYIAMYLVVLGVKKTVFNSLRSESLNVNPNAVIPKMGLDKIFPDSAITGGLFLAIIAVIIIYIILNKTTFGYQLKAVGFNRDASKYAGINEKMNIVYSMAIAGALSGLAGSIIFLTKSGIHIPTTYVLMAQGFDGIAVALLGLSNPIGILFAGVFFGYIKVGGFYLQALSFEKEIISVIVASIIYFSALSAIFKNIVRKFFPSRENLDGGDE